MRVGVTGAHGLLGLHVKAHLRARTEHEVVPGDRETFGSDSALDSFVKGCDAIVHLAGMNRGDEDVLERVNVELAESIVGACRRTATTPRIVFSNSTHRDRDTPYGRSKRRAAEVFRSWADSSSATFVDLVLPHVFGEYGKPFYNSVVSTFCYQLANGEEPSIDVDSELELFHTQRVGELVTEVISQPESGVRRAEGHPIMVSGLLEQLRHFAGEYTEGRIPDLRIPIDLELFNTFRSYWFPHRFPRPLELHTDERGTLFEAVKSLNGGQVFLSDTNPGYTRGNHFHLQKVERFLVVRGEAVIRLRRLFGGEVHEFRVSGSEPAVVDIPTLYTHNISNVGDDELLTLFWAHEIFDPSAPDTYAEPVEVESTCV